MPAAGSFREGRADGTRGFAKGCREVFSGAESQMCGQRPDQALSPGQAHPPPYSVHLKDQNLGGWMNLPQNHLVSHPGYCCWDVPGSARTLPSPKKTSASPQ